MSTIGKVATEIEWKIQKFYALSAIDCDSRDSPSFSFANASWCLRMYVNPYYSYPYCNGLFLRRISPGPAISLKFSLGFKDFNEKKVAVKHYMSTFEMAGAEHGDYKYPSTFKCDQDNDKLLPSGILRIFCALKSIEPIRESRLMPQPINILQESKVLRDFKELFLNQKDCDVILRVKGQDFRAHRTILAARSPVFESTFRNEMKEKMTGTVVIEDCDPSCFPDFLCFLYCGDIDAISEANVLGLFIMADKYDVQDLRSKCVAFIKQKLTVDTFCDTIVLAHRHSEVELISFANSFFVRNAQKIIVTSQWQSFLIENPIQSNELFIKFAASTNCSYP